MKYNEHFILDHTEENKLNLNTYDAAYFPMYEQVRQKAGVVPNVLIKCGIYDKNGKLIRNSERDGGISVGNINPINVKVPVYERMHLPKIIKKWIYDKSFTRYDFIPGHSFYLGNFFGHYGHFITEGLSRIWAFEKEKINYDNLLVSPFLFGSKIEEYHEYIFNLLDIPIEKIRVIRKPTVLESVTIPDSSWVINAKPHAICNDMYEFIYSKHIKEKSTGRVFLSRKQANYARIKNIEEIENYFKNLGFLIVYPELISIKEQLELYANCDILASFSGSALHNSLFASKNSIIIDILDYRSSNSPIPMQKGAVSLRRQELYFIPLMQYEHEKSIIDIDKFATYVKDHLQFLSRKI